MKLFPGLLHHFPRWNSLGAAIADFLHSCRNLTVPGFLDFGSGEIIDASHELFGQFDPPPRRPFQHFLFDSTVSSRHARSLSHLSGFCKSPCDLLCGSDSGEEPQGSDSQTCLDLM